MSARPSPLPNRVSALGETCATPDRGAWIGNRGAIHDGYRIARRATTDGWVCCALSFKGRRRPLMRPGRWTELFFLDEATAFAAGHRPCFYCRRPAAKAFAAAWGAARGMGRAASAKEIDAVMKVERGHVGRRRPADQAAHLARLPEASADALAPGAMVTDEGSRRAYLFDGDRFLEWSFGGYSPAAPSGRLRLLTPPSVVAAFAAGYAPQIHASAGLACAPPDAEPT